MKKPILLFSAAGLALLAGIAITLYQSSHGAKAAYLDHQADLSRKVERIYNKLTPTRVTGMPGIALLGKGFFGDLLPAYLEDENKRYEATTGLSARLFISTGTRECFTRLHNLRVKQINQFIDLFDKEMTTVVEVQKYLVLATVGEQLTAKCAVADATGDESSHEAESTAEEAPAPEPAAPASTPAASHGPALAIPAINKCGIPPLKPDYASLSAEGVAFEYPTDITTQVRKSDNGTVYQLASPDGCMRINVHHFFNIGRIDAAAMLKQEEEAHEGVTYRFKKGDTFVVAGNAEGWAYYTRGLIHGQDKAYISEVEILVPNHLVNSYSDIVAHISKSMTTTGAATAREYLEQAGDRAMRNTSRDFYRVYVNSQARKIDVDYQSDTLAANCRLGLREEKAGYNADYAYCVQSYGDNVEAREKARWGL